MTKYDAIILGTGISSLVCGNYLVRKGKKVLLIEQHSSPGGFGCGFRRKGFYFDAGLLSISAANTLFIPIIKDLGLNDKIKFYRAGYRYIIGDHLDITDFTFDKMSAGFISAFPGQADEIQRHLKNFRNYVQAVHALSALPSFMIFGIKVIIKKFFCFIKTAILHLGYFSGGIFKGNRNFTLSFYSDKESFPARFFAAQSYSGAPVSLAAGMFASFENNVYYPIKGFQHLSDTLAENIINNGGDILYNRKVTGINIKENKCYGISCIPVKNFIPSKNNDEDGKDANADIEEYFSKNIISGIDIHNTVYTLTGKKYYTREFLDRLKNSAVSDSIFTLFLSLDMTPADLSTYLKNDYVFVTGNEISEPDKKSINNPEYFKTSIFTLVTRDKEPFHAPEGKSVLMIYALVHPGWMNNWKTGENKQDGSNDFTEKRNSEYYKLKNIVMETLIKRAEKIIPELRKKIIIQEAATPVSLERYTGNPLGATVGFCWDQKKGIIPGRNFGKSFIKHPVKGLYHIGGWTQRTAGYGPAAISGKQVSALIK